MISTGYYFLKLIIGIIYYSTTQCYLRSSTDVALRSNLQQIYSCNLQLVLNLLLTTLQCYYYYVNKIHFCTKYLFWTIMLITNTAPVVREDLIGEW